MKSSLRTLSEEAATVRSGTARSPITEWQSSLEEPSLQNAGVGSPAILMIPQPLYRSRGGWADCGLPLPAERQSCARSKIQL